VNPGTASTAGPPAVPAAPDSKREVARPVGPRRERYGWRRLLGDGSGGLIAALIALPYGLAMASLMGLPPVLGIFTSILTAPILTVLGRNPVLIGGTGSVTVPFILAAVQSHGIGGAAKVTIAASVIMMAFCVLKLGRYITRVPHAVVTGFSCGIGGMMLISQLDIILGLGTPLTPSPQSSIAQLIGVLGRLDQMRLVPLVLGGLVVGGAALSARLSPRAPAPLIGVAVAIVLARVLSLHDKEVGALATAIPSFAGFAWDPKDVVEVLPQAFGLAFITSVNILITSRVVEHFRGRHKPMKPSDADGELGAYGIANIFAGMFGAPLSVGIPARSLAVVRCGGTTRMANLLHAVFLALMLWLGAGAIAHIPVPALAGVTAWMGICLLDWSAWRRLPKMARVDAAAFLVTAISVLVVNAVLAVALGCLCYALRVIYVRLMNSGARVANAAG
jgi:sulfate permease, SulP family